jgi:hypothetical protein
MNEGLRRRGIPANSLRGGKKNHGQGMKQLMGYFSIAALGVAMAACEPHSWEGETKQLFEEHGGGHAEGEHHTGTEGGHDSEKEDASGDHKGDHKKGEHATETKAHADTDTDTGHDAKPKAKAKAKGKAKGGE